ncbi:L,D-transpeptidase [Amorphus sp. 3PC139-8]|uniref:L,D-transpeptidase n=1 Tax=Amorphus sp. 3PC139-8 TaxID=2735676 RepID=UPI00345D4129
MISSVTTRRAARPAATLAIAAAVSGGLLLAPAAAQEQIFDPASSSWISYNPSQLDRGTVGRKGVPQKYKRTEVRFRTGEAPGTIIVDTDKHYLYYVLPGGKAVRYGVGVGREGFAWSGETKVGRKAQWPSWTPPAEMIARDPKLKKYAGGMPGGVDNPLGARALYLYEGNRDSLYRIHGTNEPWSIGQNVSSGCIRMLNDDVEDLYSRASVGSKVVVIQNGGLLSGF